MGEVKLSQALAGAELGNSIALDLAGLHHRGSFFSAAADSRLHPAGSNFPPQLLPVSTHTHTYIQVHTQACTLLTRLTFRGSPPPFPCNPGSPSPRCHPALDKAQRRLRKEGSQLLPAPGWVEADVSNPCLLRQRLLLCRAKKQMTSPPRRRLPPSSIPISPTERRAHGGFEEEEGRRGGGWRSGKRREDEGWSWKLVTLAKRQSSAKLHRPDFKKVEKLEARFWQVLLSRGALSARWD